MRVRGGKTVKDLLAFVFGDLLPSLLFSCTYDPSVNLLTQDFAKNAEVCAGCDEKFCQWCWDDYCGDKDRNLCQYCTEDHKRRKLLVNK